MDEHVPLDPEDVDPRSWTVHKHKVPRSCSKDERGANRLNNNKAARIEAQKVIHIFRDLFTLERNLM